MPVAVAAPHPAAVAAARQVAEAGGNALDAALAAAAALTVAYPHQCSVGGDLVAIVRPAGGPARAVLSIGAAAAAVDVAALRGAGDRMPFGGPQTVTVPGVVAGWQAIAGLGARLPLRDLLAPAIGLAAGGVPVSPGLYRAVLGRIDDVRGDPGLAALLLDATGRPRAELVQPVLAETLTAIAANWNAFYRGHLGHRLAAGLRALGSPLDVADLAAHRAEVTDPLTTVVDGVTWHAAPPPVQGATFLAVVGSPALLAASRRAQLARDALLGDPRTGPIDLDGLLLRDPRTGSVDGDGLVPGDPHSGPIDLDGLPVGDPRRLADLDVPPLRVPGRAGTAPDSGPKPAGDTVAVTAVDDQGNAVTLIQSVFQSFGSGLLDPGTGVVLHNRGSAFSLDSGHPGRIEPGARPPHTLCPTIATADGMVLALGCQGGRSQPWILAQVATGAVGSPDLAGLLVRPRWVIGAREIDRDAPTLLLEPGTPGAADLAGVAGGLRLAVETTAGLHDDAGHIQVARLRGTDLAAAGDPRADGLGAVVG
jgi:oxamate amidohydrolase